MDFFILLIIWLFIIIWTYFSKLKKKGWLLYMFLIYLLFLLFTWYNSYLGYSHWFIDNLKSFHFLFTWYLVYFFIFYFLLYFLIFPFQDKKLTIKNKLYFLVRDYVILFSVFIFFFLYTNIVWTYINYYNRYKNPVNFHNETYKCENTDIKLLLEHNYKYRPIVNQYNNFYDFYKIYWVPSKFIATNNLNNELLIKEFLVTCINKKWENFYDKYIIIHWKEPYLSPINEDLWYNYDYLLSKKEVGKVLDKLWVSTPIYWEEFVNPFSKIIYEKIPSSAACHIWKTYVVKNNRRRIIFDSQYKKTNKFTWCTIDVKKIDYFNARLFICYRDWAWSWECSTVVLDYNIKLRHFNFVWYYEYSWYWSKYKEEEIYYKKEWILEESLVEFLKYITYMNVNFNDLEGKYKNILFPKSS
jgi:hypothetical protein